MILQACESYTALVERNIPTVLMNSTGIMKENVDFLLNAVYRPFNERLNCTTQATPKGLAGV